MLKKLLIILISLNVSITFADNLLYEPNISLSLKGGNPRGMTRAGFILPLIQSETNLLYLPGIGLMDTKKAVEGNVGIGFRKRFSDYIVGTYGFYDVRKNKYNNTHQQITLGGEYLTKNMELRFNAYLPTTKAKTINKTATGTFITHGPKNVFQLNGTIQEDVPMGGFDVEIGGKLPSLPSINVFGAYYHFQGDGVKTIHGARLRGDLKINDWISLEAEINRDPIRKTAYFVGATLSYQFGHKKHKRDVLWHKMTQLPIRDVDIVTTIHSRTGQKIELASSTGKKLEETEEE